MRKTEKSTDSQPVERSSPSLPKQMFYLINNRFYVIRSIVGCLHCLPGDYITTHLTPGEIEQVRAILDPNQEMFHYPAKVAYDLWTNDLLCLKKIPVEKKQSHKQIIKEIKASWRLTHSNIVRYYDIVSSAKNEIILSMELLSHKVPIGRGSTETETHLFPSRLIEGWRQAYQQFETFLKEKEAPSKEIEENFPWKSSIPIPAMNLREFQHIYQWENSNLLPLHFLRSLFSQLFQTIQSLHLQGMAHRDLKPENIILLPSISNQEPHEQPVEGLKLTPKLIDLGTVRPLSRATNTKGTPLFRAPEFLAPELHKTTDIDGAKADMYSMGCVLYETLTGNNTHFSLREELEATKRKAGNPEVLMQHRTDWQAKISQAVDLEVIDYHIVSLVLQMLQYEANARPSANGQFLSLLAFPWEKEQADKQREIEKTREDALERILNGQAHFVLDPTRVSHIPVSPAQETEELSFEEWLTQGGTLVLGESTDLIRSKVEQEQAALQEDLERIARRHAEAMHRLDQEKDLQTERNKSLIQENVYLEAQNVELEAKLGAFRSRWSVFLLSTISVVTFLFVLLLFLTYKLTTL